MVVFGLLVAVHICVVSAAQVCQMSRAGSKLPEVISCIEEQPDGPMQVRVKLEVGLLVVHLPWLTVRA